MLAAEAAPLTTVVVPFTAIPTGVQAARDTIAKAIIISFFIVLSFTLQSTKHQENSLYDPHKSVRFLVSLAPYYAQFGLGHRDK